MIYVPFQIDRLTNQDNCDKQGKAITAMFRCVVRLEIKGCDFYCDGSGYGGDRDVIHQGQFSSIKKPFRTKLKQNYNFFKQVAKQERLRDISDLTYRIQGWHRQQPSIAGGISVGVRLLLLLLFFFLARYLEKFVSKQKDFFCGYAAEKLHLTYPAHLENIPRITIPPATQANKGQHCRNKLAYKT